MYSNHQEYPSKKEAVKKSMAILEDVQNNYKNKLRQLNYFGTKKKVIQLKFEIFQDWIKYLQEENKLLAQVVTELEDEVMKDVQSLKKSSDDVSTGISQYSGISITKSVRDDNIELQKYKSEVNNLLLFLKAIREGNTDQTNMTFYYVRSDDLYGNPPVVYTTKSDINLKNIYESKNEELQKELLKKDRLLKQQEQRILELEQQERQYKEDLQNLNIDKILASKQSNVWEASKEVTNNMIQIWDKLVDKKINNDKSNNCHVVMDKNDNALDSLQQAVNQITLDLKTQGSISHQSQGDALLFIVYDKNKKT